MVVQRSRFKVQGLALLAILVIGSTAFASAPPPTDLSGEVFGGLAGRDAIVAAINAENGHNASVSFVSNELTEPAILAAIKAARGRFENVQGIVGKTFADAHPEIVSDLRAAQVIVRTVKGDGSKLPNTFGHIGNIVYTTPFRWTAGAFDAEDAPTVKITCCDLSVVYGLEEERAQGQALYDSGKTEHPFAGKANRRGPYHLIDFSGVQSPADAQARIAAYFQTEEWDELIIPFRAAIAATRRE